MSANSVDSRRYDPDKPPEAEAPGDVAHAAGYIATAIILKRDLRSSDYVGSKRPYSRQVAFAMGRIEVTALWHREREEWHVFRDETLRRHLGGEITGRFAWFAVPARHVAFAARLQRKMHQNTVKEEELASRALADKRTPRSELAEAIRSGALDADPRAGMRALREQFGRELYAMVPGCLSHPSPGGVCPLHSLLDHYRVGHGFTAEQLADVARTASR